MPTFGNSAVNQVRRPTTVLRYFHSCYALARSPKIYCVLWLARESIDPSVRKNRKEAMVIEKDTAR